MKCIHCYREIDEHLKFCTYCGAKQPLDRAAYEREHPELAEAVSEEEDKLRPSLPDAHEEHIAQEREKFINSLLESNNSFEKEVKRLNAQLQSEKKENTKFKRLAIVATAMAVLGFILWFGSIISSHGENETPDSLVYKGKEYPMSSHGFARDTDFELLNKTEDSISFVLRSNDETRAKYPFDFELIITHVLDGDTVKVQWEVKNPSDTVDLYYSIGGHPAFNCPIYDDEKRTDYKVKFDGAGDSLEYVLILQATREVDFENPNHEKIPVWVWDGQAIGSYYIPGDYHTHISTIEPTNAS